MKKPRHRPDAAALGFLVLTAGDPHETTSRHTHVRAALPSLRPPAAWPDAPREGPARGVATVRASVAAPTRPL